VNPEVPILPETTLIHGITNADVITAPTFAKLAKNLTIGFTNCDFCGYNVKFDLGVIKGEMDRVGVAWDYAGAYILDGLRLWQVAKPRTLGDAVREWLGREPAGAHRALTDAEDALDVSLKLVEQLTEVPHTMRGLHDYCFPRDNNWIDAAGRIMWVGNSPVLSFGKHRDKPLDKVPKDYLEWILVSSFPSDVKQIIKDALDGTYPVRAQQQSPSNTEK
jgi:DNA polymerase-3 subunit epsilon